MAFITDEERANAATPEERIHLFNARMDKALTGSTDGIPNSPPDIAVLLNAAELLVPGSVDQLYRRQGDETDNTMHILLEAGGKETLSNRRKIIRDVRSKIDEFATMLPALLCQDKLFADTVVAFPKLLENIQYVITLADEHNKDLPTKLHGVIDNAKTALENIKKRTIEEPDFETRLSLYSYDCKTEHNLAPAKPSSTYRAIKKCLRDNTIPKTQLSVAESWELALKEQFQQF